MNGASGYAAHGNHDGFRGGNRDGIDGMPGAWEVGGDRAGATVRGAGHDGIDNRRTDGSRVMRGATFALRWLRAHWFRVVMALFILAATLIEWAAIPPVYPLNFVFSGASVVGIVLSPFLPRTSGWMIIATVLGRLFVLDLSGPNPLWAAYLALAIIGYDSAIPVAIGALLTVSLAECVPVALNTFNAVSATWVGMVNYIGMFTLATMGGMSFRWRRQRDEMRDHAMALERRQWQADMLKRNTRLASRIHDSASGGLSYIALTAQRQLRRTPDDPTHATERRDWEFVNAQALDVLDEIHHVIDLLEEVAPEQLTGTTGSAESAGPERLVRAGETTDSAMASGMTASAGPAESMASVRVPESAESPGPRQPRVVRESARQSRGRVSITGDATDASGGMPGHTAGGAAIARAVDTGRERLARLGFHGTFEIRGELPDDCAAESAQEAANLIGEIAANISRHLDPAVGDYCCVVTLGRSAIEIMETNPLRQPRDAEHDDGEARGRGENRASTDVAGVGSDIGGEPDGREGMAVSDANVDFSAGVPAHGSGLMMHRRIISGLGGVLNDSAEDGDWVLYARIPTRPAGDAPGRSDSGTATERNGALHSDRRIPAWLERDDGSPS
ncbi:hypothetical protein BG22_00235 [Bifidobacterium sp. UTBIF-78]|nr:hypothetical protein BG22_00235 [Bifidobacterium sp. UTBIF-78]